jgi:hypothetical protein
VLLPTPPHDSWRSHEAENQNGRWTKRPKRTPGEQCKRRTMHQATINQKKQKKGRQKEGNLPHRKLPPKKCLQKSKKQKNPPSASKRTGSNKIPHIRLTTSIHSRLVWSPGWMAPPAKKVLLWIGSPGAMAAVNTAMRLAALAYHLQQTAGGRRWWRRQHSRQKAPPQSRQNRTRIQCGAGG